MSLDLPEGLPDSRDLDDFTPEQLEALLAFDIKELPKELRIVQAKYKSRKARAEQEAKDKAEGGGESPEDVARREARTFPDLRSLEHQFGDAVEDVQLLTRTPAAIVKADTFREAASFAKRVLGYEHLAVLTAADYEDRLEVVAVLTSYEANRDLTVKARLPRADPAVPSLVPLWKGADWMEREVFDLFGVRFDGHPNLTRILMPEGWEGHPLRKDYDLSEEQYIAMDETGQDVVSRRPGEGW